MAIPKALYGRAIIPTSEADIMKLQRVENRVWRYFLGIGGYSTVESLRGEIGASSVRTRIMETMLAYIINVMNGKFNNIKEMMLDTINRKKGKWYSTVDKYRQGLEISWEELLKMDRKELKKCINRYDTKLWEKGIEESKVLKLYAQEKRKIGYEYCYNNSYNSKLYARARVNALQLEEHKGRGIKHYDTTCKLCKEEEEDLIHFLVKCKALEKRRNNEILDKHRSDPELKTRILGKYIRIL